MRLSYKWLSEYVDLHDITPQELADKMTTAGLEVEGVEPMASATGLVIGEVLECYDHPDSDHLHITKIDFDGKHESLQIVCGAPNIRKNLKVVVALPGAMMPDGMMIWPGELRGEKSFGMICSARELQLPNAPMKRGILELGPDAVVGSEFVLA